eukprot:11158530-Lingulodinium_polyedra.AAC.1
MTRLNRYSVGAAARKPYPRASHARAKTTARVECASMSFASRCASNASIRPHHCVAFPERSTMARLI